MCSERELPNLQEVGVLRCPGVLSGEGSLEEVTQPAGKIRLVKEATSLMVKGEKARLRETPRGGVVQGPRSLMPGAAPLHLAPDLCQ